MINNFAQQLWQDLNDKLQGNRAAEMSRSHFQSAVESALRKCRLVTREEFDAQQAVLTRTREKVDLLEQKVAQLEARAGHTPAADPAP